MKRQKNYRLPAITLNQIQALITATGMTETQVIITAIDHFYQTTQKKAEKQS